MNGGREAKGPNVVNVSGGGSHAVVVPHGGFAKPIPGRPDPKQRLLALQEKAPRSSEQQLALRDRAFPGG